ncbi:MAG: hypothetical protein OI860_00750 (plasmid) [Candidatus Methanoperedens sp.]|uniref:hypothetical protein n=1 Tax=Candidatus Methanoperedens sp. BLZ2 TaxID=2035255 RepID=UPI000BE27CED|nr:hypothetical protein [Candidatus Methanoperedens sp. BLZ2]KAB2945247.1 MAG: hypothetical protein F9K14_11470 [Candidatus Methanoperedens sp.]MBZ0175611.1 hypothetical protein [Candidatus Methanoperedens nitroreducens]WAH95117.1 MAG: hypothetical protein OI863_00565 [Candidatus Methanoperedens sp.]WAM22323.1 MAG: hypothetical protein OI860_00750 [Candidatus Methanoperedens sp.]
MSEEEIIHVMSAGASVHLTFPVAVNEISRATKVYVIVEDRVYQDSEVKDKQEMREKIRNSINELKKIASPFVKNGIHEKRIPKDTLEYIRNAVIEIYTENRDANFFFNVSGGTKQLSIGLFLMGLWIEAVPYLVDQDLDATKLSVPRIHIKDLTENPNRVLILNILQEQKSKRLSRKDLFDKVKQEYIQIRKPKEKRELKQGIFNALVENLIQWGLIYVNYREGSKKEKVYQITPDGEFTLNFVKLKQNTS